MYAFLTITNGKQAGTNFLLDPSRDTILGRSTDCHISLPDPLASREHAAVLFNEDGWVLRDNSSRNGTQINQQKVFDATLAAGNIIQIGKTTLQFHLTPQPPTTSQNNDRLLSQTIVQDLPIAVKESHEEILTGLPNAEQVKELMLLYQLCIKLLGSGDPDKLVYIALDLLRKRTNAAVVGFLWVNDVGELQPKLVIPEDSSAYIQLNQSLTELVLKQGHAVWIANQAADKNQQPLDKFADAVCAPLVRRSESGDRTTLGAIHVYLEEGRFRQSDFDFVISVANLVVIALVRALEYATLQSDYQRLVEKTPGYDELLGESKSMLLLKSKISKVSKAAGCVLIRGESGSGKELVARALHQASSRANRPMVSVNCAAIPADLMESHLFGHVAGSFTGADRDHAGYFQQADMGTLFLDEIGELSLEGQAKLLRILEGHPFLPVGSTQEVKVDVRVIAATNQDLSKYVRQKKFREDLYYRLSVFELSIPPLREREGDIGLLIEFFFDFYRKQHARPSLKLTSAAREKLLHYQWPGNVRQLRNVMDSAVVLAEGKTVELTDITLRDSGTESLDSLQIEQWEKKLIQEALQRSGNHVPEAAKLLGISRATLYRKIEQYNIAR